MAEHTPGPWIAERNDKAASITILGARGDGNIRQSDKYGDVVTVDCATDPDAVMFSPFNPEDEANARLIAAAPDLRDALQRVWDAYGFDPSIDSSIWADVQAALAKTEA